MMLSMAFSIARFFRGLEAEGWENHDDVNTPDAVPPKRERWGEKEDNVVPLLPGRPKMLGFVQRNFQWTTAFRSQRADVE